MTVLPTFRFDLAELPAQARFKAWSDAMAPLVDISLPPDSPPESFSASGARWVLSSLVISDGYAEAHNTCRSIRLIKADGVNRYALVVLPDGGWRGHFAGHSIVFRPGIPYLLDFTQPFSIEAAACRFIMIHMDRHVLDGVVPPSVDRHGATLEGPASEVLAAYVGLLVERLPGVSLRAADYLAAATSSMIAAGLVSSMGDRPERPRSEQFLIVEARRLIDLHIADERLSIEWLCEALATSRSALYGAFQPFSGVTGYVQRRRLMRAHELLSSAAERRPIGEIADLFRFKTLAHFSRSFRREFGYSPRDVRAEACSAGSGQLDVIAASYREWVIRFGW